MLPVIQTITEADPATGVVGDCWRTALASCFDIEDPTTVPHFIAMANTDLEPNKWWSQTCYWVAEQQNLQIQWVDVQRLSDVPKILERNPDAHPYAVLCGDSPRGEWLHAVVVELKTGKIVHDPFPKGGGRLGKLSDVTYFVGLN